MITVDIEIEDKDGEGRFRTIKRMVDTITTKTCNELMQFAQTQMQEGEMVYQMCAKRPHVKDESLPQPFWDYFNGSKLIDWWNGNLGNPPPQT